LPASFGTQKLWIGVDRDVELVGGDEVAEGRVAVLPPPQVPVDLDGEHVLLRLLGDVEDGEHRREGHSDEEQGRNDRPAELQLGVAVDLDRIGTAGAVPVPDDRGDEEPLHKNEHDCRDRHHEEEEIVLLVGDRPVRVQSVLRGVSGTAGQEHKDGR
jgi:hypothetical protein